ncbi:tryptophan synthase subunit alpha [Allonocardiopsis opalescens]|uniref:Tryptophan synthase alpha chain n=1 Tax=Allonocardiopsis opalescens TaxID=1144618 RepID=A0A2T0Q405_9ACTN|nr:tryptophan synthase subunit alpha [Allonocardiopsis opalescens]PRX98530.1 tryptophan synthase alpha chain [Allonocardiopsis opalescens]
MTTLSDALGRARREGRAALVGYLPAGFPDLAGSIRVIEAMVEGGCDVIEVGWPYSDPTMDGPVIQRAADRALAAGTTPADVIEVVRATAATGAAALVMSYWNPIDRYGVDRFAADFAAAGGAGVITPDLIPEEAGDWLKASDAADLDRIFLVAPSSTDERIGITVRACRGFVYAASLMGVTGTRAEVGAAAAGLVARTRAATELPVCVGLGVSTGEQAAQVAGYADGVIVGSAFCARVLDAGGVDSALPRVRELAAELAAGVRAGA